MASKKTCVQTCLALLAARGVFGLLTRRVLLALLSLGRPSADGGLGSGQHSCPRARPDPHLHAAAKDGSHALSTEGHCAAQLEDNFGLRVGLFIAALLLSLVLEFMLLLWNLLHRAGCIATILAIDLSSEVLHIPRAPLSASFQESTH